MCFLPAAAISFWLMQVGTCPLQTQVSALSLDFPVTGSVPPWLCGLLVAGAQSRTVDLDNQRAGGLGHNSDFITGEDERRCNTALSSVERKITFIFKIK